MKHIKILLSFFIVLLFCNQKTYAQIGTLDPTFGDGGIIISDSLSFVNKSIVIEDGKIYIFSSSNTLDRVNPDGSFDFNFGNGGRAYFRFNGLLHSANYDFAIQDDGKIVCTGKYYSITGNILSGIFRSNLDGTLDSSFGENGLDTVKIDKQQYPTGIVIQEDGKIVVSGDVRREYNDQKRTYMYRLMPNGGLDPTFGVNGIVVTHYDNETTSVGLIQTPDGKLILGSNYNVLDFHPAYQLERFNQDGSVDAGFGINGKAKFIFGEGQTGDWNTRMNVIVIQTDGKIVAAGMSGKGNEDMALCRFNENGKTDVSFGENGGVITPYSNKYDSRILGITTESNGKILATGFFYKDEWPLLLARYTENGQLDEQFGNNGITEISNSPSSIFGCSVHSLTEGKILVTGVSSPPIGGLSYLLLARFNGDNILAANFKDVKAAQNKDAITITWQTLNESGTKSFTVERSSNANDYVGINTIPAKGVASIYNYTDKNPLDGISYYRIRENAVNGTNTFSPVVKVVFNSTGVISLYPNPAKNTVTVKGLNKNIIAIIKITDMQGREISSQNFTQSSSATLNIRALAQGTYFVQVAQQDKIVRLKLIKE